MDWRGGGGGGGGGGADQMILFKMGHNIFVPCELMVRSQYTFGPLLQQTERKLDDSFPPLEITLFLICYK